MSAVTSIQWTDRTWNPVRGCSVVSPGCVNCYAMKQAHRFSGPGKAYECLTKQTKAGPQWTGQIRLVEDALLEPLSWRKPARIFVNSMSDLFHEGVPEEFIDRVFAVMALAPRHTFQILTKRADRMRAYFDDECRWALIEGNTQLLYSRLHPDESPESISMSLAVNGPLPNVWLGVSCEDQQRADERIPLLLQAPAAVRFISAEPLLGPIDLGFLEPCDHARQSCLDIGCWRGIDWVIVGGESGSRARVCSQDWIRSLVRQCRSGSVPVFVKQIGTRSAFGEPGVNGGMRPTDRQGGDPSEWPADLRVREFPRSAVAS